MDGETRVRLLMLLLYLSLAATYLTGSLSKFHSGKVATDRRREPTEDGTDLAEYPSVTVCSGFRDLGRDVRTVAREYSHGDDDNDDGDADGDGDGGILGPAAFDGMTYGRADLLTYFTQASDGDWSRNLTLDDSFWTERRHPYFGGRCHTFDPKEKTKSDTVDIQIYCT